MARPQLVIGQALLAFIVIAIVAIGFVAQPASAQSVGADGEAGLWRALREGSAFAVMRHALAPGVGDPAGFRLDDCATQRNLSEEGRQQARAIGGRFRANGIATAEVMTSQWCRARDTATALGLGAVRDLPALNSFFARSRDRDAQTAELRRWLAAAAKGRPLVLVTHQVNISALTDAFTSSGEIIVARLTPDGAIQVLGSL